MQGSRRPLYAQVLLRKRLTRDIADILSHDFSSSSAIVSVYPVQDCNSSSPGGLHLSLCILEGPYRGGHFLFLLDIPENYPFRGVDIWCKVPTWHPNIDIRTGRVALPLQWSPVLSLVSIGVAIQMIMLEPSSETPLNLESCSYYCGDSKTFDTYVQHTLHGCTINGIVLPCMFDTDCHNCNCHQSAISSLSNTPDHDYDDNTSFNEPSLSSNWTGHGRKRNGNFLSTDSDSNIHNRNLISSYPPDSDPYHMDDCVQSSSINNSSNNNISRNNHSNNDEDTENCDFLQSFKRMKYDEECES